MRIGVAGITGKMGRLVAKEIQQAGAHLQGGTSRSRPIPEHDAAGVPTLSALAESCDAVIDFTQAASVQDHAQACSRAGCAWILGTTGLTPADQAAVADAATRIAVVQAANFAPGMHTVLALAERLGAILADADAEIVEMHHRDKRDAPSGTALAMGRAVASGRGQALDAVRIPPRDGQSGARMPGGIGFASLRGGQIVGEHSLVLTADDEQIVLTHRAFDRAVFARGAVRAALWSAGRKPGLYGMKDVLDMKTQDRETPA
jgi:4-hydroxy-tetrahydrodipicolinate reductase